MQSTLQQVLPEKMSADELFRRVLEKIDDDRDQQEDPAHPGKKPEGKHLPKVVQEATDRCFGRLMVSAPHDLSHMPKLFAEGQCAKDDHAEQPHPPALGNKVHILSPPESSWEQCYCWQDLTLDLRHCH